MPDDETCSPANKRTPWNKGKLIGARPPLRPKHIWSIRTRLLVEGRIRDLALFNLAIDSKLRGCDVAAVKVEDVAPNGYTMDRATVRQKKTGRPVKFELTDQTRQAIDDYLKAARKKPGEFLGLCQHSEIIFVRLKARASTYRQSSYSVEISSPV
jgi:integrase